MKLAQYFNVFLLAVSLFSCAKKSEASKTIEGSIDSSAVAGEPEFCNEFRESHDHAPGDGYTASNQNRFHVKVDWSSPLLAGELNNSATVTFLSPHGEALPLTLKSFKLFMPSMGHGSIKTDKLILTQNPNEMNVWSVGQIYFSMGGAAGDWVVDIEGSACGLSDKARVLIQQSVD
ncbi:MAG: hypothetical protein NTX25_02575 [Proteobacteria bacterium]|nr:hypothetical protein [Pseudomonadota bacterium]